MSHAAAAAEFARMAHELHDQPDVEQTIDRVLTFARSAIAAQRAGVLLRGGRKIETVTAADPLVDKAVQIALECGEGPGLSVISDPACAGGIRVADTLVDPRWPQWGPRVAELGLRSVLSIRLYTSEATIGALNLYAERPDAFDADDEAVAHVLARHASIAVAHARQETSLWQAIDARKLIGQAQGMLMERFDLDAEQAFAVLRRYSQHNNIKLRMVAQQLIDTRRLPD